MTESNLKSFLQERFSPANQKTLLNHLFSDGLTVFSQPKILIEAADNVQLAQQIGSVSLSDGRNLAIMDVVVTDAVQIARNRKGLRDIAAKYIDQNIIHGALVFFHSPTQVDYRLTFIARYSAFDLDTLELVQNETAPKRFAFVLGPNEPCTTASRRLMELIEKRTVDLKALTEAFAVEPLNKEFFKQFKDVHFKKIWTYLAEYHWADFLGDEPVPTDPKEKDKRAKPIRDFAKKMLGRIVFLHFLQKKGWMGCSETSVIWANGDKRFMQTLFERFTFSDQFYSRCLTKLFFDTLNNPDRTDSSIFEIDGLKTCRVPYLNGGLFDRDIRPDGHFVTDAIDLPVDYFRDLFQFFDQYNFTIDENSPGDYEVGIDPEMLGHIFENLLEENREKGAFYTPKEIVQYMCQESLIQHLTYHLTIELGDSQRPAIQEAITELIRAGSRGDEKNRHNLILQHAPRIEELLDDLKICDPAIGSGAFPVGMLQEIFAAKMTLDLTLNRAEVKKRIIGETIYGVDMETGAVDIARLRFWLSLVVDEDEPQPLPNLDYKIMQGDSLLESFEGIRLDKILQQQEVTYVVENGQIDIFGRIADPQISMHFSDEKKEKLRDLLRLYYDPEALKRRGLKKETVKAQIETIVHDHLDSSFELAERSLERQTGDLKAEIRSIETAMRNNPNEPKAKRKQKEDQVVRKQKNIDGLQTQLASVRASQQKLSTLDSASKPYFLWHLFFPEVFDRAQSGFDIVIANPPYLQLSRIPTEAAQYQREGYQTFEKTGDIYGLFYEQGIRLLRPGGMLSYITSNSWLQTQYGKPLRQLFVEQTNPLTLLNFADTRLFETAVVETNILLARKAPCQFQLQAATVGADFDKDKENLTSYISRNAFIITDLPAEGWAVGDEQGSQLKRLMEENGKKLGNWPVIMNYGVKTGYNSAFVIDGKTKQKLIAEEGKNADIIKPTLRGRDLRRYNFVSADLWIIFIPWHFPLHNDPTITGGSKKAEEAFKQQFPSLYAHLLVHKEGLSKRNQAETGIRYEWYALQRCAASYFEDFNKPKIIWAELSDIPKFAYDESKMVPDKTTFIMTGTNLKYLLGVLNAKPALWYFNQIATTTGMVTTMWSKFKMEQLPVPEPDAETEQQLEKLVNTVLALKKANPSVDTLSYEAQIDALVFRAYGLSETDMLYVLDQFPSVSSREREMIQNNFRNLARGHFTALA
ncbi:Eco57I restriction-modification methylase domain-containing protein [Larkinella punicea]|uniref:site-specific DNA-methyltransferase (adenine-specific) n=1 Tax=Larkinella punicea TaxID=2315727 RepID=A0A368JLB3_9BACT|nr:TaqI-like C-terminal specificity domain-containing protein [Larkinella punicea]RCR68449.1 hypothetical protein DUE52_17035 [Larkinella punicea]